MDVRLTNVYVADAKLVADGQAQPEDAMAVFAGPAGRGRVSPFMVRRSYTGAGGWYAERLVLLAPSGDVVWQSPTQPITLRGSNKIDTFTTEVHGVEVDSDEDHELVFLVSDGRSSGLLHRAPNILEVGRVPLSVLDEDPPYATASGAGVLQEALKRGTIVWIEVPGQARRAVPAWYGLLDGRIYVLCGGSEQQLPGLAEADRVLLSARSKEQQALVARVEAGVRVVPATDPLFNRVVPVLLPRRLNLHDGEAAAERWRKECTLVELTPSGVPVET
jgi:hypothetical protein